MPGSLDEWLAELHDLLEPLGRDREAICLELQQHAEDAGFSIKELIREFGPPTTYAETLLAALETSHGKIIRYSSIATAFFVILLVSMMLKPALHYLDEPQTLTAYGWGEWFAQITGILMGYLLSKALLNSGFIPTKFYQEDGVPQ